ncbi:MAG: hypothetical protein H0V01_11395 [Bacteroidetes bacterium]|nr:hypothetical protein [Bacteroidota bacterium]HET6243371.1 DUF6089 family protein [Bacteroidia bacterium]
MRKYLFILFLSLFILPATGIAQYAWDYGFGLGGANYLGEIGGLAKSRRGFVNDIKISQTRPAITGFARHRISPTLLVKGSLSGLRIQGSDNLSTNPGRVGRNLNFRNDIVELAGTAEINFYQPNDIGNSRRFRLDFRSYVFFGLGAFYHSPKTNYNGEWVKLQPLRTEGQIKPYSRIQMSIPMGVGFYYTYKRKHRIGWEFGWRKTFTDYLDDISTQYATNEQLNNDPNTVAIANRRNEISGEGIPHRNNYAPGEKRGDPSNKDNYFVSTINYSYVIRGKSNFYRSQYNFIWGKGGRKKRKTRAKF